MQLENLDIEYFQLLHYNDHNASVKRGEWENSPDWCYWNYPLIELAGKTMGIIGYGRIGQSTGRIAQAFGMKVLAYDQYKNQSLESNTMKYVELDELLKKSDVICLHCPLFENTKGIINKDTISRMKDGVKIAAGGLGAGLMAFLNGTLKKGIEIVIQYSGLEEKIKRANIVWTGEGSIDFQTQYGKTPLGVAEIAKKYNKPVIALAGRIGEDIEVLYDKGIDSVFCITRNLTTLEEALEKGKENIEKTSENIIRLLSLM